MGCHLWGRTELDTTEATWQQQQHYILSMKINPSAPMSCFTQILTGEKSEPSGALSLSPGPPPPVLCLISFFCPSQDAIICVTLAIYLFEDQMANEV